MGFRRIATLTQKLMQIGLIQIKRPPDRPR